MVIYFKNVKFAIYLKVFNKYISIYSWLKRAVFLATLLKTIIIYFNLFRKELDDKGKIGEYIMLT